MGQPRQQSPLHGWSRHHRCFMEMGFIMSWLRFRSLFCFNNCDSAKHPSSQAITVACSASGAQNYLRWKHRTLGYGEADLGSFESNLLVLQMRTRRPVVGVGLAQGHPTILRRIQMASERVHAALGKLSHCSGPLSNTARTAWIHLYTDFFSIDSCGSNGIVQGSTLRLGIALGAVTMGPETAIIANVH